jgi:hypothetical protein
MAAAGDTTTTATASTNELQNGRLLSDILKGGALDSFKEGFQRKGSAKEAE